MEFLSTDTNSILNYDYSVKLSSVFRKNEINIGFDQIYMYVVNLLRYLVTGQKSTFQVAEISVFARNVAQYQNRFFFSFIFERWELHEELEYTGVLYCLWCTPCTP